MQDKFKQIVTHTKTKSRRGEFGVESGFYTDQLMKDELKYSECLNCTSRHVQSQVLLDALYCFATKFKPQSYSEVLPG